VEVKQEESTAVATREAAPVAHRESVSLDTGEIVPLPDLTRGISEVPITDKEAEILRRPADPITECDIRYDGAVYMPGACLRKRLLDAFGPGRWAMRQEAPIIWDRDTSEIVVDYSLWVKGHFVSRAQAGWTWNPQNPRMSKSDSIESAMTECLRRLCKNLGVGLELWMPGVSDAWKAKYAETYRNDKGKTCWRRKNAPSRIEDAGERGTTAPTQMGDAVSGGPNPSPASDAPKCPKCSGPMWDNRDKRRQDEAELAAGTRQKKPRAAWSCKDKACGGVIWPSEPEKPPAALPSGANAQSPEPDAPCVEASKTQIKKLLTEVTELLNHGVTFDMEPGEKQPKTTGEIFAAATDLPYGKLTQAQADEAIKKLRSWVLQASSAERF